MGLGLFSVGALVYLKSPWLGLALVVPGVAEMIWWTSPNFRFMGTMPEFERLLNNKLIFTNLALALVVGAWIVARRIECRGVNASAV
jgi:hypothetical protein